MRYVLGRDYVLRGWDKSPTGLVDSLSKEIAFLNRDEYLLLLKCDGATEIKEEDLSEEERGFLDHLLDIKVIRAALPGEVLRREQEYYAYPNRFRKDVQWSITGACNYKCLHCFMSAPHNKHGNPTLEELIEIADQLKECGVLRAQLTGGEPLIRKDFLTIVKCLLERGIGISVIYTNGDLLDETLLDTLEEYGTLPNFQLSYDGAGCHDFLRGVEGAEEKTIAALKLLQKRKAKVSVSMCLHRKNAETLRESINLMASLGVKEMKCGRINDQGEWTDQRTEELRLSPEEEQSIFENYIPAYFEDDAPVSIMLGGSFMYTKGEDQWGIFHERNCSAESEDETASCGLLLSSFFIGAEGNVTPCMSMNDCEHATDFPNIKTTPLKDILSDSPFTRQCGATVGDIRNHNKKCRECEFVQRCAGGCRSEALIKTGDYYSVDPDVCAFFENRWDERIRKAAQPAFEKYIKRNGIKTVS